jgi:molybdate transport system substrate-binding protein
MLKVLGARAPQQAIIKIAQEFTRQGGPEVGFAWAPMGVVRQRLADGEAADVLIISTTAVPELELADALLAGSRVDLGTTHIGVAVRTGAPRPDIATPEAFERTLRAARSIALSDLSVGGTAGTYLRGLFDRLGLAEEIARKAVWTSGGGEAAERVADGTAELAMTFISEILPIKGVQVVGPLPAPYGNSTTYAAAISTKSRQEQAAGALIRELADPGTREIWTAAGFETS